MGECKYIRVATTLYKKVRKPLHSGDFIEVRVPWNYDTFKQDHSKDSVANIEKYDGFCCVPNHIDYNSVIGTFLNEYEPIDIEPKAGSFDKIMAFLNHIFGEHIELGLDYLQLLYLNPLQRLPILMLVSKERNTGKTTFLNLLKAIFGANMTFNTNEDFRSQFNSDWATKLIVAVDEVLLDRKEDSERIKNLSTARNYKAEAKGKDRNEVEFFAKFVLCSNNEVNPIYIEEGENRYWVRRVVPFVADNPNLLLEMKEEIPALLFFLLHRKMHTQKESRMWFLPKHIKTDALKKIIYSNRGRVEMEMLQIIDDVMATIKIETFYFCIGDIDLILQMRGVHCEHSKIKNILKNKWSLEPNEPRRYTTYQVMYDGTIEPRSKMGRCYSVDKAKLDKIL